jgi:hypothetical protein
MKLIFFSAIFMLAISATSCKSGDKCGTCPKFSEVENDGTKEQV